MLLRLGYTIHESELTCISFLSVGITAQNNIATNFPKRCYNGPITPQKTCNLTKERADREVRRDDHEQEGPIKNHCKRGEIVVSVKEGKVYEMLIRQREMSLNDTLKVVG